ncbi:MAG: efflux RND transporter periplasmic adaptor subunit [Phycisphaerales bacterium]
MLCAITWATGPAAAQNDGPPPANVVVDEVRLEELVRRRSVTGEIRSRLVSSLASQVEGLLVSVAFEEGDEVDSGEVIARLDDARAQIAAERAESDVEYAKSVIAQRQVEFDNASRDLERIEELERLGSSGISQLDQARTLVASREALLSQARAELVTAEGDLALARRELEDMTIRAPFDGRVVVKMREVGEWVGLGDEIVTIVSLDQLEARVDIPEDVYSAVRGAMDGGEPIELRLPAMPAGVEITGRILSILPAADSLSRLFPVRIAVHDPDRRLRPGMSLNAMVPTGSREDYITVSKDAIVRTPTGEVVYFVSDGVSAVAPVERIFAVGDRMAVRSPMLQDGMSVVVSGNERLFPGQPLNIQQARGAGDNAGSAGSGGGSVDGGGSGSNASAPGGGE